MSRSYCSKPRNSFAHRIAGGYVQTENCPETLASGAEDNWCAVRLLDLLSALTGRPRRARARRNSRRRTRREQDRGSVLAAHATDECFNPPRRATEEVKSVYERKGLSDCGV